MAAKSRAEHTLADYVVIALSPLLIMALVGSLVFFLVEVLYVGDFGGRMRWILFFFVFGAVLVSRMTLETYAAERAGLYGLILGVLTWIGLQRYVAYTPDGPLAGLGPVINALLIIIIWWSAHRLTKDCTHIDDAEEASGEGLLNACVSRNDEPESEPSPPATENKRRRKKDNGPRTTDKGLLGWWERYRQYRDAKARRPHNPGVWVVYFSLAALPLYGVGQSLIPPEDVERRQNAFWFMTVYVGSGLGLLLTTAFLGLRRYLRQRNLKMPVSMTGVWLTAGGLMVGLLLCAGALLPRPYAEYSLFDATKAFVANQRQASKYATSGQDAGKGEGSASSKQSPDQKQGAPGGSRTRPGSRGKDKGGASSKARGKGGSRSDKQKGQARDERGKNASDKSEDQDGKKKDEDNNSGNNQEEKQSKGTPSERSRGQTRAPSRNVSLNRLPSLPAGLSNIVKWIVYILLGLAALWFVLKFLANFTSWARSLVAALQSLWQSLFGWTSGATEATTEEEEKEPPAPRPFAAFHNPFASGAADGAAPEALVRYSFEALQAFAFEHGLARQPDETPLEFTDRLGGELPALEADARRLAALYARAAYARGRLAEAAKDTVRQFWQALEAAPARPVSAARPSS
jgi:hypothetical protein